MYLPGTTEEGTFKLTLHRQTQWRGRYPYVGLDERSADTYTILSDSYSTSGVIQGFDISLISYLTGKYAATLGLHFGIATMYAIDHQVRYTENGSEYFRQYNSGSIRPLSYRMGFSLGTAF